MINGFTNDISIEKNLTNFFQPLWKTHKMLYCFSTMKIKALLIKILSTNVSFLLQLFNSYYWFIILKTEHERFHWKTFVARSWLHELKRKTKWNQEYEIFIILKWNTETCWLFKRLFFHMLNSCLSRKYLNDYLGILTNALNWFKKESNISNVYTQLGFTGPT